MLQMVSSRFYRSGPWVCRVSSAGPVRDCARPSACRSGSHGSMSAYGRSQLGEFLFLLGETSKKKIRSRGTRASSADHPRSRNTKGSIVQLSLILGYGNPRSVRTGATELVDMFIVSGSTMVDLIQSFLAADRRLDRLAGLPFSPSFVLVCFLFLSSSFSSSSPSVQFQTCLNSPRSAAVKKTAPVHAG